MDSGAYRGQSHVKRVWDTMARRVDVNGNPVTPSQAGQLSNTNTDRAFLLLMLTISSPMIEVSEDGTHAWGQWHIFGPHTNRVFDRRPKPRRIPPSGSQASTTMSLSRKMGSGRF